MHASVDGPSAACRAGVWLHVCDGVPVLLEAVLLHQRLPCGRLCGREPVSCVSLRGCSSCDFPQATQVPGLPQSGRDYAGVVRGRAQRALADWRAFGVRTALAVHHAASGAWVAIRRRHDGINQGVVDFVAVQECMRQI